MQQLHSPKSDLLRKYKFETQSDYWSAQAGLCGDVLLVFGGQWMKWEDLVLDVYQVGNGAWAKHTHTHTLVLLNWVDPTGTHSCWASDGQMTNETMFSSTNAVFILCVWHYALHLLAIVISIYVYNKNSAHCEDTLTALYSTFKMTALDSDLNLM